MLLGQSPILDFSTLARPAEIFSDHVRLLEAPRQLTSLGLIRVGVVLAANFLPASLRLRSDRFRWHAHKLRPSVE